VDNHNFIVVVFSVAGEGKEEIKSDLYSKGSAINGLGRLISGGRRL
jgi:hypothetical protein